MVYFSTYIYHNRNNNVITVSNYTVNAIPIPVIINCLKPKLLRFEKMCGTRISPNYPYEKPYANINKILHFKFYTAGLCW